MIRRWTDPPLEKDESGPKGFDDFDLRIGDIMRGERATMGKSLLDVQRELRIKASFIAAIENADVSAFETPGFIAGFVRSYARYLNLDPDWAFRKFCDEANFNSVHGMSPAASVMKSKPVAAPVRATPRDPFAEPSTPFAPRGETLMSRIEPGALGSVAVLVALIGVIGYGGWSVLQEIQRVEFVPVDQAPGVVAEIDTLGGEAPSPYAMADADVATPDPDALGRLYRPEALDVPVMTSRDGPIAGLAPGSLGALAGPDTGTEIARATPTRPEAPAAGAVTDEPEVRVLAEGPPEVVMFAVRPSWVRVSGADGTVLFEKILDAGERYTLPVTEEPPLLRAGNAGSVYFEIAGQTYGPAGDGPSVVKNLALGPEELTGTFAVADMSADEDLAKIVAIAEALSGNE